MKTCQDSREGRTVRVFVNSRPLDPRFYLWNHSPTGFEWGMAVVARRNWRWRS